MLTVLANTQTAITSDTNQRNLSMTQKSDSKTQSMEEVESKMKISMEASSKAGGFF